MKVRAFSFLETLLVLFIIGLMWIFTFRLPTKEWQSSIESRLFFNQLTAQINYVQQLAIMKNQAQTVIFDANNHAIYFPDVVLEMPSEWYLLKNYFYTYLPNGRIDHFSTVTFIHRDGNRVNLVFQLGSGKFDIQS